MTLDILDRSRGRLVELRVSSRITADDVERASTHPDKVIEESGGGLRLLVEIPELHGSRTGRLVQGSMPPR